MYSGVHAVLSSGKGVVQALLGKKYQNLTPTYVTEITR